MSTYVNTIVIVADVYIVYVHCVWISYVYTWVEQININRFYSYVISPHFTLIFSSILFSDVGNDQDTSDNSGRYRFLNFMFIWKCTMFFVPSDILVTITTYRTCKYSTEWSSSTCISRLGDKCWSRNYTKYI